jgi:hypothetical protein
VRCAAHRQRDLVGGVSSGPVDAGLQEARPDTPAPVAAVHHHPEVSDTARKVDPEVTNQNAIGLRDECGCLLEVEFSGHPPPSATTASLVRNERSRARGHLTRRSSAVEGVCDERWGDVVTQKGNQSP